MKWDLLHFTVVSYGSSISSYAIKISTHVTQHAKERERLRKLIDLGSVCFGFKWFQEIIFCKIGCLVGFENRIFRKLFSFDCKN